MTQEREQQTKQKVTNKKTAAGLQDLFHIASCMLYLGRLLMFMLHEVYEQLKYERTAM